MLSATRCCVARGDTWNEKRSFYRFLGTGEVVHRNDFANLGGHTLHY
jgi:hypothetical protein